MSTLLWVALLLVAVLVVGYFLLTGKQKGPFEIINNISVFFDELKEKVENLIAQFQSLSKYIINLHERISSILELFKTAEQQRAAVEERLKQHLTDHVDKRFDALVAGLDQHTERVFNALDMQRKVLVTELTKTVQTSAGSHLLSTLEAIQSVKEAVSSPLVSPDTLAEPPKVDLDKAGGPPGYVADPELKGSEPVAKAAPAKAGRGRKKA